MLMVGRVKSADSCLHGKGQGHTTYREKKEAAKMLEINKERNERIKILEVQQNTFIAITLIKK